MVSFIEIEEVFSTPFPLFLEIIMQRSEESLSPSNNKTSSRSMDESSFQSY